MPEQLNLLETDRETAKRWFAHIRALLTAGCREAYGTEGDRSMTQNDEPVFGVLDSVRGEMADSLTYAEAVAEFHLICEDYASEGWTVEYGWASAGNYSAAKLTNVIEGRPHERFVSIERDEE